METTEKTEKTSVEFEQALRMLRRELVWMPEFNLAVLEFLTQLHTAFDVRMTEGGGWYRRVAAYIGKDIKDFKKLCCARGFQLAESKAETTIKLADCIIVLCKHPSEVRAKLLEILTAEVGALVKNRDDVRSRRSRVAGIIGALDLKTKLLFLVLDELRLLSVYPDKISSFEDIFEKLRENSDSILTQVNEDSSLCEQGDIQFLCESYDLAKSLNQVA